MTEESSSSSSVNGSSQRRWAKRLGWALAAILALAGCAALFIQSPIGKRLVADEIAAMAPASGLRFEVGRIEGDIYNTAILHDVIVSDSKGPFLTTPKIRMDWRPLAYLWNGLDIRELGVERGEFTRLPELQPGDPDAPILPDFGIRVDRLSIEDLVLSAGLAGPDRQIANLEAQLDLGDGTALVLVDGQIGEQDHLNLRLLAAPEDDRFELQFSYDAPEGGAIDQLAQLNAGYRARIAGEGSWTEWLGHALVERKQGAIEQTVAAFQLTNSAGQYGALGQFRPLRDDAGDGVIDTLIGSVLSVSATGTLYESVWDGEIRAVAKAFDSRSDGSIDLARNAMDGFRTRIQLRNPQSFGESVSIADGSIDALFEGPFQDLAIEHTISLAKLELGQVRLQQLRQTGIAKVIRGGWAVPIQLDASDLQANIAGLDNAPLDASAAGVIEFDGNRISANGTSIRAGPLAATIDLDGNLAADRYALTGTVNSSGLVLSNLGRADGIAKLIVNAGFNRPWELRVNFAGNLSELSNETAESALGETIAARGSLSLGQNEPLVLRGITLESEKLDAQFDSRRVEGVLSLYGQGRHRDFGELDFEGRWQEGGPEGSLSLASPFPAADLRDVVLSFVPNDDGYSIDTDGQSLAGPFSGKLALRLPANEPAKLSIESFRVWRTDVSGSVELGSNGAQGQLAMIGGGLDGSATIDQGPQGQTFVLDLVAQNASFGGDTTIQIDQATLRLRGAEIDGAWELDGDVDGAALRYGQLYLDRFIANAEIKDGTGDVTASIAGRRSERFTLQLDADVAADEISLLAGGEFAGRRISMPQRAVFSKGQSGGWSLAPAQIGLEDGFAIFEGFFADDEAAIQAKMANLPMALADLVVDDLGLGGRLTGTFAFNQAAGGQPTGELRAKIDSFSRTGLVMSSRPVDALAVIELGVNSVNGGLVLRDGDRQIGKIAGSVANLPQQGSLSDRIVRGRVDADLSFEGPAESLWRLTGIETLNLMGNVSLEASIAGSIAEPEFFGSARSDDLHLRSAASGTEITDLRARARFAGQTLSLTGLAGRTAGGGSVTGSGTIDLSDLDAPKFDIRSSAKRAQLINLPGFSATLTGPLRIKSRANGGVIAGRLTVDSASWRFGQAFDENALPEILTREVNLPAAQADRASSRPQSWSYLIDARARRGIDVRGLGLESEWAADISLRGTTSDPRIGGQANLVDGDYTFAGVRFELARGRIQFNENVAINPQLDIQADGNRNGIDVSVRIAGTSERPEITLASQPSLPQEEILAQLLFGGSISTLSATDAIQLGTALASLRGGAGLDPINRLRRSIGLDQLRIVAADPALNRGTALAAGKNISSQLYAEFVTDGQDYSATTVEFRVSRWLSLLGTISGLGRNQVLVEISRDY